MLFLLACATHGVTLTTDSAADTAGTCDADTTSDPHNCGACGHDCLGGTCDEGACSAVTLADPSDADETQPARLTLYGGNAWWTDREASELRSVSIDGGNVSIEHVGAPGGAGIDASNDVIAWATAEDVRTITSSGRDETVIDSAIAGAGVATDGSSVWWSDLDSGNITRVDLEAMTTESVVESASHPYDLQLDGDTLYWVDDDGAWSIPAAGGDVRALDFREATRVRCSVAGGWMWWADRDTGIWRVPTDAHLEATLVAVGTGAAIAAADDWVFYVADGAAWAWTDDRSPMLLAEGAEIQDIAVDDRAVYILGGDVLLSKIARPL